jgi:choline kinase
MVLSLMAARSWLSKEPVIVCYSDIFVSPQMISYLESASGDLCVMYDPNWLDLWKERNEDPLEDAETFRLEGARIIEIGQKPKVIEDIQGQYMGLLKFTPKGWAQFEETVLALDEHIQRKISMTEVLQLMIAQGFDIQGVKLNGLWGEVDTPSDLQLYEEKAKAGAYQGWF